MEAGHRRKQSRDELSKRRSRWKSHHKQATAPAVEPSLNTRSLKLPVGFDSRFLSTRFFSKDAGLKKEFTIERIQKKMIIC